LLGNHLLILGIIYRGNAVLFQFFAKLIAGFEELAFLGVVLFFDLSQLSLQLLLMHSQWLNLALQYLHPGSCYHTAHIRNHRLGKDLIDETMIARKSGMGDVFYTQTVIGILFIFSWLNVNPPLSGPDAPGFRILDNWSSTTFGLHIGLVCWRATVHCHVAIILLFFGLVLLSVLMLLLLGQISPHLTNDLAHFP
jgi:hypothetical protein